MVISSFSPVTSTNLSPHLFLLSPKPSLRTPRYRPSQIFYFARYAASSGRNALISSSINQNPPRSLFPGGYKRPEIKVPNIILRLSSDDVLRDDRAILDAVDDAVSGRVGIVLLTGGEGSGKKLYEAACLLKSVIRDRAYLLIDERVDIAAAAFCFLIKDMAEENCLNGHVRDMRAIFMGWFLFFEIDMIITTF